MFLLFHAKFQDIFTTLFSSRFGYILGPFVPKNLRTRYFSKSHAPSLFKFDETLTSCKTAENSDQLFQRKCLGKWAYGRRVFYRTFTSKFNRHYIQNDKVIQNDNLPVGTILVGNKIIQIKTGNSTHLLALISFQLHCIFHNKS